MNLDQTTLPISEIFFSIEGEGIRIGEPTIYIRVFGCPHKCTFCDSSYATEGSIKQHLRTLNSIISEVNDIIVDNQLENINIEYTGGSPDFYPDQVATLINCFKQQYKDKLHNTLQISGGIYNNYPILKERTLYYSNRDLLNMVELIASDCKDDREDIPFILPLKFFRKQDEIKFLIKDDHSYDFVKNKIKYFLKEEVQSKFIITTVTNNQEQGIAEDHLKTLKYWAERILADVDFPKTNIKILPREHVLLWGNKKGV